MVSKKQVNKFVKSQESIQFYKKIQGALTEVLQAMPNEDFHKVTKNLKIISLQEGIIGQAMVFPNSKGKFKVVSIVYVPKIPMNVLKFIIAHELGHIHQGRHNTKKGENIYILEKHANKMAKKWGFPPTEKTWEWIFKYMKKYKIKWPKDWPKE
ncbi:MAG: hypothetical protein ABIJ20_04900 [Nanoarchaeota archaeon]|nr:hypothetical protein [Nanoarchaeota archaeon]MBU1444962.1 hypothetical protein [Nanoarchaeota archaeon]MBU2420416.1 hypothetical protein [Nanoarchaeota archaeon]MBU2475716.1 hypothetical protein [Nanoarchaeota archaeon]